MKKLALNAIVLGVFASVITLTSCEFFGLKDSKGPVEKVNDSIAANHDSVKMDTIAVDSLNIVQPSETVSDSIVK